MLKLVPRISPSHPAQVELDRRMQGPQRHRLLQGYPMPGLMKEVSRQQPFSEPVIPDPQRPLIVGILPHASCNPAVAGCGYCTFPHETFQRSQVSQTVQAVIKELSLSPLRGRKVEALYFGGGTANLTPVDDFSQLCGAARRSFDLNGAEVTLEGAPLYFTSQRQAHLETLQREFPQSQLRLSMGVQTFNLSMLERMGRQKIGHPQAVARAVQAAQRRGMTTSADMLINLPGQSRQSMQEDLQRASDLGFSQICLYHLVLFRGLGTPWARDRDLLQALPDHAQALDNWLEMRDLLLSLGYQQRSLTNFERQGHYRYEECSYTPERYDGVGFGPEALSTFTDRTTSMAVKWMNESSSADYRQALETSSSARARCFVYGQVDLRILHLTRTLPRLYLDRSTYTEFFSSDPLQDFAEEFQALQSAGLVNIPNQPDSIELTPKGMYYADSVAGLLAWRRVAEIRRGERNEARYFVMG